MSMSNMTTYHGSSMISNMTVEASMPNDGAADQPAVNNEQQQHTGMDQQQENRNENDVDRIFASLSTLPVHEQYPELLAKCRPTIQLWHDAFSTIDPVLWRKMRRAIPKELNESAFVIDEMMQLCEERGEDQPPYTIIDMCSGIGYLSMFLSHLLPAEKCSRIVAVDTLFQANDKIIASTSSAGTIQGKDVEGEDAVAAAGGIQEEKQQQQSQHMSTKHLTSSIHPIPIRPRKANIKKGRELRQIAEHCVDNAPGPVIILGVHLCKSLSVHTVRLFNNTNASRLYLKPCCLPGRKDLKRREPPFWTFENMAGGGFGVKNLYCSEVNGNIETSSSEGTVNRDIDKALKQMGRDAKGEDVESKQQEDHVTCGVRSHALFSRWTNLLKQAADTCEEGVTAKIYYCSVQKKHFQNQYIVALRGNVVGKD